MIENGISGILTINKSAGMTSHDVVNKIRRLYGTKKVGHAGTLDPDATGVLVVLVGRAAKAAEFAVCERKEYRAGLLLGITTDTQDTSGKILSSSDNIPPKEEVLEAVNSFSGEIMQIPPMYSALKVGGKKLCDIARAGITVEREARPITIYSIKADGDGKNYTLDVSCSAGTYIRTLCHDIGEKLGCGGAMSSLVRKASGGFSIENAVTLEEIERMDISERESLLMPTENLFKELQTVKLPAFYERLAQNGAEIYQKKIGTSFENGTLLRVYGKDGFFGIGKVSDFEEGSAVKIIKFL